MQYNNYVKLKYKIPYKFYVRLKILLNNCERIPNMWIAQGHTQHPGVISTLLVF